MPRTKDSKLIANWPGSGYTYKLLALPRGFGERAEYDLVGIENSTGVRRVDMHLDHNCELVAGHYNYNLADIMAQAPRNACLIISRFLAKETT